MAVVSAAQATNTLVTHTSPPTESGSWNKTFPAQLKTLQNLPTDSRPSKSHSHVLSHQITRPNVLQQNTDTQLSMRPTENAPPSSAQTNVTSSKDSSITGTGSVDHSLLESHELEKRGMNSLDSSYRRGRNGSISKDEEDTENSRWIHRDKLALIENQELKAAGIFVPRSRAPSKASTRRDPSKDLQLYDTPTEPASQFQPRSDSLPSEEEEAPENNTWDLRLPTEATTEDFYMDNSGGAKGISRIPVNKKSPFPIPMAHLERDKILPRKKSGILSSEDEGLTYSKNRESIGNAKDAGNSRRSASENIITKKPTARPRSASVSRVNAQRPCNISGSGPPSQVTFPRASENSQVSSRHPEGDPPWLSTMYKPDPRLPPDQQLLPTVARRLQQQKWEKEGKFGTVYDTSFRPLNDQPFTTRPTSVIEQTPKDNASQNEDVINVEWPLQSPKSPTLSTGRPGTAAGYSTMPKIIEASPTFQPLSSPKFPKKILEPPEAEKKEGVKCGCCTIM